MASSEEKAILVHEGGDTPTPEVTPIKFLSDVQPGTWHQLLVKMNLPSEVKFEERVGHTLVSVPKRGHAFMLGGGNHYGEVEQVMKLEFDSEGDESFKDRLRCSLKSELSAAFPGRYEFLCGVNEDNSRIWIFGGADLAGARNDICVIDLDSSAILNPFVGTKEGVHDDKNVPVPRTQGTNSCLMKIKDEECLVVFGGGLKCEKAVPDGNLYVYNLGEGSWRKVEVCGSTPNPVQGHGMVTIGTSIYVFGGMNEFHLTPDFYTIDLSVEKPGWVKIMATGEKPCARAAYGIATVGNNIIVCGGLGDDGALADLWNFNIESKEWTELNSGEEASFNPRLDFGMTTLIVPDKAGQSKTFILIHGGMNTYGTIFTDFWIFPLDL